MAGADEEVPEMKARIKRAGIDAPLLAVIIELPFQIAVGTGTHAQPRYHWRKSPGIGNKGNAGKACGGGQDVARAVHDCATKSGIGKILHFDFPTHKFICARGCTRSIGSYSLDAAGGRATCCLIVAFRTLPPGKQPLQQADLNFIGVAENVSEVKANNGTEILHSVGVAIDHSWLNGVLNF